MKRRDFLAASVGAAAIASGVATTSASPEGPTNQPCSAPPFPKVGGVTKYVADFVGNTKFSDIPGDVVELGKKSILDGLGLALSGSRAETANLIQNYAKSFGFTNRGATVIGSSGKLPSRFAAFANGVAIHVEALEPPQVSVIRILPSIRVGRQRSPHPVFGDHLVALPASAVEVELAKFKQVAAA